MKKFASYLFLATSGILFLSFLKSSSKTAFPIESGAHKFTSIFEWVDHGAIMIAQVSTNKKSNSVGLVTEAQKIIWTETINPSKDETFILANSSAGYFYFFEQLEIDNNQLRYHQLSRGGLSVPKDINFAGLFRTAKIPIEKVKTRNITVSSEALVFEFEAELVPDVITNIAVIMQHHNHLPLLTILGTRNLKDKVYLAQHYSYTYSGSGTDHVSFFRHGTNTKTKNYEIVEYNYRGKLIASKTLPIPSKFTAHTRTNLALDAMYYLNKTEQGFNGEVREQDGKYVVFGFEGGTEESLACYSYDKDNKPFLNSKTTFKKPLATKNQLALVPHKKGFFVRMGAPKQDFCVNYANNNFDLNPVIYNKSMHLNPSLISIGSKANYDNFYIPLGLASSKYFYFNYKDLNSGQAINFEAL